VQLATVRVGLVERGRGDTQEEVSPVTMEAELPLVSLSLSLSLSVV
jgi:hypothetical protein